MSKKQKIWRLYEQIPGADWVFMGGILLNFTSGLEKFGIKNYTQESLCIHKHFENAYYFYPDKYHKTQQDILQRVTANPEWGLKLNQKLEKLNNQYFAIARRVEKTNLKSLSNKQLANLWKKLYQAKEEAHALGVINTWIIDADEQPFTKYLTDQIAALVKKANIQESAVSIFPILTTPPKNSYVQEEEMALFRLLRKMQKTGLTSIKSKIKAHADKYGWVYYKYIGPAKTASEYEDILKDWDKQKIDPESKLQELSAQKTKLKQKQIRLLKLVKPPAKTRQLIKFAQEVVFLKDHRKMSQFYGSFVNEKILTEISRRLYLTLKQVRHFMPWEIAPALEKSSADPTILNQRYEFSILYTHKANFNIMTRQKARQFLRKQKFEEVKTDVKQIKGSCACPGKVKNIVTRIDIPEEIKKIESGEIMVSHVTYPALVPAMKKAGAIVTDEGGLTCHTAIVSRELGVPCIVGTKGATQILKDGDRVEVNATKGIVRIIKKQ